MHDRIREARRPRAPRAPMLRVEGCVSGSGKPLVVFHLPLPPLGGASLRAVHALERRAKKAYFAVLDAMRTGVVDAERSAQLRRLAGEVRTRRSGGMVADALEQLVTVMGAIATGVAGAPSVPELNQPLVALVVGVTSGSTPLPVSAEALAELLSWPLEWLRTRGVTVTNGLEIHWIRPGLMSGASGL
jgi:hypothetical protein